MTENQSIEPTVRLPRQVAARADRARQLLKPAQPAVADPPPAEKADAPVPAPSPTDASPAPDVPRDPREDDPKYWRQRFKVTDGMWRQERETSRTAIAERDAQIATLTAEVARLKQQPSAPAQVDLTKYLTADEIAVLGEEQATTLVSMSERMVADRVRAEVEAQTAALKAKPPAQAEPAAKPSKFLDGLDEQVPTWRDINEEAEWIAFLRERDDRTGLIRQRIVDMAQQDDDPDPVVTLLRQFIAKMNPTPTPAGPPVVPQGTGAGVPPTNAGAVQAVGMPTTAEIREHFKLRSLNKLSEAQMKEFDARLKAAQQVGQR